MQVTTERLEGCQVKVIVEIDAGDIDKELRQTARKLSRQYNIPGYRRGKAPYHAVLRVFGREAVQQQAIEDFGNDLYEKALEEIDYEPYEVGELQEVEWDPFRMTIMLPIEPEVDLGDYRAVRVPFEPEAITDERLEEYLKELQQSHAQWVPVDRAAAVDDLVVIDAVGKIGDEEVLSHKDHELILEEESNIPLPGFHAEIVGMSPGEEKTFLLTYPEDDPRDELAGKEASFTVKLHTAKEQDLPALDDDLAMMVGDYDSLDALTAAIRENLETEALQRAETEYLDAILEAMIEGAPKLEYPTQAIDREADFVMNQMERNLASTGLQLDNYLGMVGKTRETYRRELRPSAEERLRKRLVLRQVATLEGLEADPEEIEAEIDRLSEVLGEEAEQMRDILDTPGGRLSVAEDLVLAQVQERIKQIAKGEAPPLEEAEAGVEAEPETEADIEAEVEPEPPTEESEAGAQAEAEPGPPTEESEAGAKTEAEPESPDEEPDSEGETEARAEARSEESDEPPADTSAETEDAAADEQAEANQPD